jgi:hypothetical protein
VDGIGAETGVDHAPIVQVGEHHRPGGIRPRVLVVDDRHQVGGGVDGGGRRLLLELDLLVRQARWAGQGPAKCAGLDVLDADLPVRVHDRDGATVADLGGGALRAELLEVARRFDVSEDDTLLLRLDYLEVVVRKPAWR